MNENEIREIVKNAIIASKSEMNLPLAERVADAVIEEAKRIGVKAVVCISDAAGNPKLVKVMEDAYIASYDIAVI